MAVSYGTAGTLTYPTGNASATLPASISAGDYLILAIGNKPDTVVPGYPGDQVVNRGWTLLSYQAGGGGTTGIDTGPTSLAIYGRVADGTESGTTNSVLTGNSVSWVQMYRFTNATGHWDVAADGGIDSTTGTAWSVTVGSDIGLTAGDMCFVASCIPTDVTTPSQFTNEAVAATGATMGTMTEISEPDSSAGNDIGGFTFYQPVSSGTSSAAATITATAGGTTTNVRGPSILVRLREISEPAVTLVTTAGADFLTSGTTKTSSSFTVAVDDVIVVALASDEPATTFGNIVNSGTGFTWTLEQSRQTGGAAVPPTYVWTTTATAAQSMTVSIDRLTAPADAFWGFSIHVFRGGTLGNSALNFGTASAASVGLTTSAAGSAVSVFLADENGTLFEAPSQITAVGGSRVNVTHYQNDLAWLNDLHWWHSDTGSAGSKTFGFSQGSLDWTIVAVEIAPATGNITASPSAIASAEVFGTAVVTATLASSPTAIGSAEAFGTVSVDNPGPIVNPTGIASSEAIGTATITAALTVSPSGIASAETFGSVAVALTLTASPGGIASAETFGTPTVALTLTASPGGIGSAETFGTPAVALTLTASPSGIASAEEFGTVEVSTLYAVHPDPITSAEAFGTPAVDIPTTASPSGIASLEAFGTVEIQTGYTATPTGIATGEAFGSPAVGSILTASPSGVASGESFGSPDVTTPLTVAPGGISSAEALGTPTIDLTLDVAPSGIASEEAFGTPNAGNTYTVTPDGIASAEGFGTVSVAQVLTVSPAGIGAAETFGTPEVSGLLEVYPSGIASAAAVGTPDISLTLLVEPAGIDTGEAVGQPDVTLTLLVVVGGIGSAEAFGTPEVSLDAHHPTITTTLGVRNRYATGTPGNDPASLTISEDKANLGAKNRSGTNTPRERGAS